MRKRAWLAIAVPITVAGIITAAALGALLRIDAKASRSRRWH